MGCVELVSFTVDYVVTWLDSTCSEGYVAFGLGPICRCEGWEERERACCCSQVMNDKHLVLAKGI